jgi:hypothetical protein
MDAVTVKKKLAEYMQSEFVKEKMTWEEAEELEKVRVSIPDDMEETVLMEKVKALDDDNKKLTPIVMKILGEWGQK